MKKVNLLLLAGLMASALQASTTARIERVFDLEGLVLMPSYPMLDKRVISRTRGGDRDDYASSVDGVGVAIIGRIGEAVDPMYGNYNRLLQTYPDVRGTIDDKITDGLIPEGEIVLSDSYLNGSGCTNVTTCDIGFTFNDVTARCELPATCSDMTMTFNGVECTKDVFVPGSSSITISNSSYYTHPNGNITGFIKTAGGFKGVANGTLSGEMQIGSDGTSVIGGDLGELVFPDPYLEFVNSRGTLRMYYSTDDNVAGVYGIISINPTTMAITIGDQLLETNNYPTESHRGLEQVGNSMRFIYNTADVSYNDGPTFTFEKMNAVDSLIAETDSPSCASGIFSAVYGSCIGNATTTCE